MTDDQNQYVDSYLVIKFGTIRNELYINMHIYVTLWFYYRCIYIEDQNMPYCIEIIPLNFHSTRDHYD